MPARRSTLGGDPSAPLDDLEGAPVKPFSFLSLLSLALVPCALLPAAAPPAGPLGAEVARLIGQLADDDFDARERATERLKLAGEPALDTLHAATRSDDPELRRRAARVVSAVEARRYGPELLLADHKDKVWGVCVSADGKRLLTRSADRTLRLWDASTGKCLRVFKVNTARDCGAALSPDGKRVLSGGEDLRLWDAGTGKELRKTGWYRDGISSVAFGPRGKALTGSADTENWGYRGSHDSGSLRLWDLHTGKCVLSVKAHSGDVHTIAYSEKAQLAATCSYSDSSIRLWDLATGKQARELGRDCPRKASSVCFSADGKRLLAAVGDGTLRIWDVGTGEELVKIQTPHEPYPTCAAFSSDGKRIVSGGGWEFDGRDNVVRLWDADTGKKLREYEGHARGVTGVAYFPDGRRIASASYDGTVRVWRAPR